MTVPYAVGKKTSESTRSSRVQVGAAAEFLFTTRFTVVTPAPTLKIWFNDTIISNTPVGNAEDMVMFFNCEPTVAVPAFDNLRV